MHPSITKTARVMAAAFALLLFVALLPLGVAKAPAAGLLCLVIGSCCFAMAGLGYLHGQMIDLSWPFKILYAKDSKLLFAFNVLLFILAGSLALLGAVGGLLAHA